MSGYDSMDRVFTRCTVQILIVVLDLACFKDVDAAIAEELLAAAPGLFIRHPSSGKLKVTNARDHEKHLEKVLNHAHAWIVNIIV